MNDSTDQSFVKYLAAKKTVDDRALNKTVWESLRREIRSISSDEPVRALEIGAGIGTMVERALEWGLFERADYLALDAMPGNITEAASRVPRSAESLGFEVKPQSGSYRFIRGATEVTLRLTTSDVFDFIGEQSGPTGWDLLIANAFLDLIDVPRALPRLLSTLRPGGLFYFTITFDGATILEPQIDPALDARIQALYHQTMDRRIVQGKPSGDSRTGRHFFQHVRSVGANILEAGSSDWTVFAGPAGYRADERFFLHFIIDTMASALADGPELEAETLREWTRLRHAQIEDGVLVYIAHQMDFLGRAP
jgi:SAM-dependent methyltransferase